MFAPANRLARRKPGLGYAWLNLKVFSSCGGGCHHLLPSKLAKSLNAHFIISDHRKKTADATILRAQYRVARGSAMRIWLKLP
jgi:hypothetical protein